MKVSIRHPFDRESVYELTEENQVRVTRGEQQGLFTAEGIHIEGEIRQADPQLCVWICNNPEPPLP